jgi:hypothetical protein
MSPTSQSGVVHGTVRFGSGRPAGDFALIPKPTALPAGRLTHKGHMTNADGYYQMALPPATYTIKVLGTSSSGTDFCGEVTGVVVTSGSELTVDVTVTEHHN